MLANTFALIGTFALANETNKKDSEKKEEKKVESVAACSSWQEVGVSCGKNFWLCKDGKTTQDLADEAYFFSQDRC